MATRWSPLGPWRSPSAFHFGSSSSSWEPCTRPGWWRASAEREGGVDWPGIPAGSGLRTSSTPSRVRPTRCTAWTWRTTRASRTRIVASRSCGETWTTPCGRSWRRRRWGTLPSATAGESSRRCGPRASCCARAPRPHMLVRREGSRRTLSRTVSLRSLTEDAHDGRAAHGALALCGPPAVLQGRLFALELSLGLALHAISLVRRQSIHLLRVLGGPHLRAPSDSLRGRAIGRPRQGFSGQDATSSSTPGLAPPCRLLYQVVSQEKSVHPGV